jgi:hypothetical protein
MRYIRQWNNPVNLRERESLSEMWRKSSHGSALQRFKYITHKSKLFWISYDAFIQHDFKDKFKNSIVPIFQRISLPFFVPLNSGVRIMRGATESNKYQENVCKMWKIKWNEDVIQTENSNYKLRVCWQCAVIIDQTIMESWLQICFVMWRQKKGLPDLHSCPNKLQC